MKQFLLLEEQIKITEKFTEWSEQNHAAYGPVNLLVFLYEHDALNLDKCRELIKEQVPVTDELTKDHYKQVINENLKQKAILMDISNDISDRMKSWGDNGRLIDRDFVFAFLTALKRDAENALKENE